ncbi:flagellar protein FlhE [Micromonospora cathayae]|uniref:Flagellar protein FlhE n=1 Tax=Micromonospora cathayae TaxID=3028804 RepID=A0ABY7ZIS5_9ACTN|nr:flagellar protein FlhE [Micromonospora sp. HUAS 3]WDZ82855.1 flagellar protein FlhE [Micromonospora sp. HUAS 3]
MSPWRKALLSLAAVLTLVLVAPATPAVAAVGSYGVSPSGGTVYRTNTVYSSSFANSPIAVPAGSTITGVSWQFNLSSYPSNLTRQLCNLQRCETLWTFGGNSGTSTYFNGDPASNSWYFRFTLVFGSGSSVINPPVYAYTHNVAVTYQY